ncbi:MAG: peroxiredoxin [Pyrinomonadaceae bacterium]
MSPSTKMQIGTHAPDFVLSDTKNREWRLSDHRGKVVALLFYPGDETLVCTKQLCAVRDNWGKYMATGADVVGISPGSADQHLKFAENHNLPLPLLADPERKITTLFASHWLFPVWATRGVIIIDALGILRFKSVMIRALRPTDDEVLSSINLAKYDELSGRKTAVAAD